MSFMQKQVTEKVDWYQLDTVREGIVSIPADVMSIEEFADNYDMEPEDVEVIQGYGARMSAPGYMDCTEWAVFDSLEEAEEYLEEYYGDDDDTEEEPHHV
jgi:hypothetical protein